jgi:hypothetical protein
MLLTKEYRELYEAHYEQVANVICVPFPMVSVVYCRSKQLLTRYYRAKHPILPVCSILFLSGLQSFISMSLPYVVVGKALIPTFGVISGTLWAPEPKNNW